MSTRLIDGTLSRRDRLRPAPAASAFPKGPRPRLGCRRPHEVRDLPSGRPIPGHRMAASQNGGGTGHSYSGTVARRCLIVDDNRGFLDAARAILEQQGMTVVGVASTGADAVDSAAA